MRALPLLLVLGCAAPRLEHEAYVWQRSWTPAVRAGVSEALPELTRLRVLAVELDREGRAVAPDVDAASLRGRPVIAVARVEGSRLPDELSLARLDAVVRAWRAAGVRVVGLEIDHDCATAALADYTRWLGEMRHAHAGERWSITALPAWADAPADLARLGGVVDEVVVQVHAVRAPAIFDAAEARRWLERFAAAAPGVRLRVALPTYRAVVGGRLRAAEPAEVASFLRALERDPVPGVVGVVWFRLPIAGETTAWPAATLGAVIRGEPLVAAVSVHPVMRAPGQIDLVIENRGSLAGPLPPLRLAGALDAADLAQGYRPDPRDPRRWLPPEREVAAGARTVVGWATGEDLDVTTD